MILLSVALQLETIALAAPAEGICEEEPQKACKWDPFAGQTGDCTEACVSTDSEYTCECKKKHNENDCYCHAALKPAEL